jgi:hypothetical protein
MNLTAGPLAERVMRATVFVSPANLMTAYDGQPAASRARTKSQLLAAVNQALEQAQAERAEAERAAAAAEDDRAMAEQEAEKALAKRDAARKAADEMLTTARAAATKLASSESFPLNSTGVADQHPQAAHDEDVTAEEERLAAAMRKINTAARRATKPWSIEAERANERADAARALAAHAAERAKTARGAAAKAGDAHRAAERAASRARAAWLTKTRSAYALRAEASRDDARSAKDEALAASGGRRAPAPGPSTRPCEPGLVQEPETCEDYYRTTRRTYRAYSMAAGLLPIFVALISLALAGWLISRDRDGSITSVCNGGFATEGWLRSVLTEGDLAGRVRFAAAYIVHFSVCILAIYFGLASTRRILNVHWDDVRATFPTLHQALPATSAPRRLPVLFCFLSAGAFSFALWLLFGDAVDDALQPFFGGLANSIGYCRTGGFETALYWLALLGALAACPAAVALIFGAATIAFRFERDDINGAWSDSYVLREKLNALLTLLFIAAALLVVANVAFGALVDWTMQIGAAAKDTADLMKDVEAAQDPAPSSLLGQALSAMAHLLGAIPQAIEAVLRDIETIAQASGLFPPQRNAIQEANEAAAQLATLKPFASALTSFTGIMSSLLLIAVFAPSFLALIDDINIAGKTHASYDMDEGADRADNAHPNSATTPAAAQPPRTSLAPPYPVAGWSAVSEWKKKHGLTLSVTDMTSTFLAIAAPLLSSTVIDLSKVVVGH